MSLSLFERLILGEAAGDPPTSMMPPNQPPKKKNNPPDPNQQGGGDEPPDFTATDGNDEQQPNHNDPLNPPDQPPTEDQGDPSLNPPEEPPAGEGGRDDMGGDMNPPDQPPEGEGAEGGEEGNPEEMPEGPSDGVQVPGEQQGDDLKSAESELFTDLGPDKLAIKTEELKNRFKDLYDSINGSLNKLDKISRTTDDADEIDFLVRKLLDIRDLSRDALIKSFNTKTYVENQIELKRLIALYSAITNGFSDILHRRHQEQVESNKAGKTKFPKLDHLSGFTKTYDVQ